MYWGLLAVGGIAFSCSTEFIPEVNVKLDLVPFTMEFKVIMTVVMLVDYVGCYAVEVILKHFYSDFRPKDIAVRRKDQLETEQKRKMDEIKEMEGKKASEAYSQLEKDKKFPSALT